MIEAVIQGFICFSALKHLHYIKEGQQASAILRKVFRKNALTGAENCIFFSSAILFSCMLAILERVTLPISVSFSVHLHSMPCRARYGTLFLSLVCDMFLRRVFLQSLLWLCSFSSSCRMLRKLLPFGYRISRLTTRFLLACAVCAGFPGA